jgi:protein-tyrosine phosphatase
MQTRVIKVRTVEDIAPAARAGAEALEKGKLVAFATETVYGVATVASIPESLERLRELKSRPQRPFSVHMGCAGDVTKYVESIPHDASRLMAKSWPGPVTLVLPTGGKLADPKLQKLSLHDVLCWEDTIGLRFPDEPTAQLMLSEVDAPVVAPSANLSGRPSPRSAEDVLDSLDGRIDLLIDSGPTRYGKDSTIVVFDADGGWKVVREGVFDDRMIRKMLRRKILFVCTGNTCRSPLAAGLARKLLAEKLGVEVGDLRKENVEILSAGTFAMDGGRASPEAVEAAREYDADISHHRSRKLTTELIQSADMVFCMTDSHVADVRRMAPSAAGKIRRLDEAEDISDPIGSGSSAYRRTAKHIQQALERLWNEGQL